MSHASSAWRNSAGVLRRLDLRAQRPLQGIGQRAGQRPHLRKVEGMVAGIVVGQQVIDRGRQGVDVGARLGAALVLLRRGIALGAKEGRRRLVQPRLCGPLHPRLGRAKVDQAAPRRWSGPR